MDGKKVDGTVGICGDWTSGRHRRETGSVTRKNVEKDSERRQRIREIEIDRYGESEAGRGREGRGRRDG